MRDTGVGLYNPPAILDPGNFAGMDRIILDLDRNINFCLEFEMSTNGFGQFIKKKILRVEMRQITSCKPK